MKKLLTAALLFASAFAFAEGYEDWFTPPDKWEKVEVPVKLLVNDEGSPATVDFSVNITDSLNHMLWLFDEATAGLSESAKIAFKASRIALANSLYASCQAHMNKMKIDNLGAALEGVFVSTYGQYVDESGNVISKSRSGVDTAKLRQQLLANKNAVVSGGQAAGGSEKNPLTIVVTQKPYDESQFEQHVADGRSLTSLLGWYDLADDGGEGTGGADGWALATKDYYFPFSNGKSGNLGWKKWNGWDTGCLSAGSDVAGGSDDKPLRLYGWTEANNCDESIQNLLTNETATADRSAHKILTRYDDGNGATIHWMPFDESVIGGGSEGHADDKTIELTYDEGASSDDPKKFRLKGFETANSAAASDPKDAKIPMADGSENLAWKKPIDLFNSSVFDADSSGKVILKATVAEEGKTEVMTITQSGSGGSVSSQTLEGKTLDFLTDGASLGSVEVSGDDKIGIKSWDRPQDTKASYTIASRLKLTHTDALDNPTTSPAVLVRDDGVLKYTAIGCLDPIPPIDGVSITTNSEDGAVYDGVLSIFGYADAEEGDYLRMGAEGLEWTPLAEYDGISIETNDVGQVGIVGFEEALASLEGESDGALVPYIDSGSTELQWGGMMEFFADSVFRQSETTGKILLNGTSEEGKVKVLAMTGTGGDDQHVNALTFDARSVDGANGVVQVHGFDMAPSPFGDGVNFADALTNMNVSTANMSVPLRVPVTNGNGYEVMYAPLAKVTGIPAAPVDDITIEVNQEDPLNPKLQLHGAAGDGITLEEGDVYMIGSDGKGKFGKGTGADGDDSEAESGFNSLESYSNTDGDRFLRLKGWDTSYETPHVVGKDGDMKYYEVNGGGGIETHTSVAGDQLQLSGYDTAANGALPYKVNDGNGISWLAGVDDRVPLLHNSGAPTTMAIGGSLDKANVSAVPTLNVSGFTAGGNCTAKLNTMLSDPNDGSNRSAHQFMARYSSGGGTPTVHWVSIDDVIGGGGSPVDDTSITTNTSHGASSDGVASIFGFSTASAGDIPHKTDDGKIEWKPVANGGALIVSGTSGSTVTTATCTNKLSFVSASDSNVKFTVTDKGDGNVEVKIGVYYK